jgi:hypothetical protein
MKDEILKLEEIDHKPDALLKKLNPRAVDHSNLEQEEGDVARENECINKSAQRARSRYKTEIHHPTTDR